MSRAGVEKALNEFAVLVEDAPESLSKFMADVLKGGVPESKVAAWLKAYWALHARMQVEMGSDWYNHVVLAKEDE